MKMNFKNRPVIEEEVKEDARESNMSAVNELEDSTNKWSRHWTSQQVLNSEQDAPLRSDFSTVTDPSNALLLQPAVWDIHQVLIGSNRNRVDGLADLFA